VTLFELVVELAASGDVTATAKTRLLAYANRRPAVAVYAAAVEMVRLHRKAKRPLAAARKAALEKFKCEVDCVASLRKEIEKPGGATYRAIKNKHSDSLRNDLHENENDRDK